MSEMKENKMGTMSVGKLLISMSLPMMISMIVQAMYNIVDSIFVSRIHEDALTAVSMAFPLQSLCIALGAGMGVGVNALLSRSLGAKDQKMVNKSAMNGIFLTLVNYILFLLIGLTLVKPFYMIQTDSQDIINYGTQYLSVVCCFSFGMFFQFIFERLLQSTGRTFQTMITQTTGAIINIILDPIFIFGLFGVKAYGVRGAAIATVIGQIVAAIFALIMNLKVNKEIQFSLKEFKPDLHIIGLIYKVGFPSIIMQSIGSLMVFCLNKILIVFTSTAVAVFGVYFKLQSFVFMPVFGLNNGIIPIIAYNYGAEKKKRMLDTVKCALLVAFSIMTVGSIVFISIPDKLLSMFDASENMLTMGMVALRTIAIHFPVAAICIVLGSTFQALGNAIYSMFVSIARQIVVLIPVAYFLSQLGNVNYVWWCFPIAEVMSLSITLIFFFRMKKMVIDPIPN
ncbi:MAG: MATE family efflux transporter [Lachnospiraceae bacterium]|nr:MATE family efflux transporter [Lachnospiraceae bacterium]